MTPRVAFVQDGARLHYGVPVGLADAGALEVVFVDVFAAPGSWVRRLGVWGAELGIPRAGALAGRYASGLPPRLVRQRPLLRAWIELRRRLAGDRIGGHLLESRLVSRWVRQVGLARSNVLHGFVRNLAPELCRWARGEGLVVTADQIIAPAATEQREYALQVERWPDWIGVESAADYGRIGELEAETWAALDHLVCPSSYVASEMGALGVSRCSVHPYPVDPLVPRRRTPSPSGRLTVGFVGSVSLRKGAPYFHAVARRLRDRMSFVMVGPVLVSAVARRALSECVELVGSVPRTEVAGWLDRFDVVLFPSTCEGCAGALQEAIAAGVPVVVSPNAGSVVRSEIEGFVRRYDDVDGLVECLERLDADRALLAELGERARARGAEYDCRRYGGRLARTFGALLEARGAEAREGS